MNDDFEIANEVNEGVFEQGWYAVFEIEHTVQAVQQAWQWIFPKTLEAGYRIDEKLYVACENANRNQGDFQSQAKNRYIGNNVKT